MNRQARVVILKTGTTYPAIRETSGDFEDWFVRGLSDELELTVINVEQGDAPGNVEDWDGIVITGSPAMVSDRAEWSETTAQWLTGAVDKKVPVLGVCYGHQLLAHALGGEVGYHPEGRETGTWSIELLPDADSDPLFADLPASFKVQLTHKQSVLGLPPGAVLLGRSRFEPHQAFRVGECAWGVQFHPEFTDDIMRAYLSVQTPELAAECLNPDALLAAVEPAPVASGLLQRFSELVIEKLD
ncbi:glutamine amidotransferase [Marinobacter sp. F4218]|uniref:glutamine amidotransferase n=1 Tax=Marinobacter sp. F4218 TaxID=2862868 RepID=UPI002B45B62A|nr:glutamine amidotransferase [Marinobacter sp. F4218]